MHKGDLANPLLPAWTWKLALTIAAAFLIFAGFYEGCSGSEARATPSTIPSSTPITTGAASSGSRTIIAPVDGPVDGFSEEEIYIPRGMRYKIEAIGGPIRGRTVTGREFDVWPDVVQKSDHRWPSEECRFRFKSLGEEDVKVLVTWRER